MALHIENKKNRLNELLNDEIKVFYSFLQRVEKLPNTKDLQRLLKEKMTDLDALKGYNFSNGTLDGSDFITSGRVVNVKSPNGNQLTFTLHDYFPQPHKYTKWLIHQNNKTLTKNDVLSLLLYISKCLYSMKFLAISRKLRLILHKQTLEKPFLCQHFE